MATNHAYGPGSSTEAPRQGSSNQASRQGAPIRLTAVLTHPIQYFAPWFRFLAESAPALDLTVLYATAPTPAQQGVGFGRAFAWDRALTDGHRCQIVRPARPGDEVSSERFFGLDVPAIVGALRATRPEVVLVPGWHSATLLRALLACRRDGVPALYRGDTTLLTAPTGLRGAAWALRTRALLALYSGYLVVGKRSEEYLHHVGIRDHNLFASPHCVDNGHFAATAAPHQTATGRAAARHAFHLGEGDFAVLFVGKLSPVKRLPDLIHAAARLGAQAAVVVVGSGEGEAEARALAARLGVRVHFAGFLNQAELGRAYAAADCLALPSAGESWGLVVNEALATGLPCVVSDRVGCAPDLVVPGSTGATFPIGDEGALAAALERIRGRLAAGHDFAPACRARAEAHSFARASDGLVRACRVLARRPVPRRPAAPVVATDGPGKARPVRVVACCGSMSNFSGLERMTFEVLRVAREHGAPVLCIVNRWHNARIIDEAEAIGASWSTGFYWYQFNRRSRDPRELARFAEDIARTSWGLVRDARRFGATVVLVPDFLTAVRNAPALALLRATGTRVVLRLGNNPRPGRTHRFFWRRVVDPGVDVYAPNSRFILAGLLAHGIAPARAEVVANTLASRRVAAPEIDAATDGPTRDPRRVIYVGQIIREKGIHVLLEAAAALVRAGHDLRVDVVGKPTDGRVGYDDEIAALARVPELDGRVRLLGHREDVQALLAASGIHCVPSLPEQEEGFANVVTEAKQAALPSVVMPSGALPELVEHGVDGWVCRDSSTAALADGLTHFLVDEAARVRAGLAARASLARFGRERFSTTWWRLLSTGGRR